MIERRRDHCAHPYELGQFGAEGCRVAVSEFVTRYNEIVDDVETDPNLKIEFKQQIEDRRTARLAGIISRSWAFRSKMQVLFEWFA